MRDATDMVAPVRPPLSKERIIEAAVAFADAHGIDELSMRRLGAELGVEAMSLYNHVANKDDILDGMIDDVMGSIPTPATDLGWQEWVRRTGVAAMETLTAHPWVVTLLLQRGNFGPSSLGFMDRALGVLRSAGFDDLDATHVWHLLASHTMGYALQQTVGTFPQQDPAEAERLLTSMAQTFPNVGALAPLLVNCVFSYEYALGLDIIIEGLQGRLAAGRP